MVMRQNICLNGLWDFCRGDGNLDAIPERWEKTKIVVPCPWNINSFSAPQELKYGKEAIFLRGGECNLYPEYPKEWEAANSGWYKTEFFVSEDWKGNQITLCFNAVHYYSEYYINGELVIADSDGFLPVEFDINRYIIWGEFNTLVVGVRKMELFKTKLQDGEEICEIPTGSFWGMHIAGIWQDVYLNIYPSIYIKDVFVYTDINKRLINVNCEISGIETGRYTIEYILMEYMGDNVCNLGIYEKKTDSTQSCSFDYTAFEKDIKLWWPDSPRLYLIDTVLRENENIVDTKTTRFGFRSFEIKGNKFYLNEVPYNLRNDSWHYMGFAYQKEEYARLWYKMARDAHANCIRLHAQPYPEFFLDIADEEGMLIIDESAVWASHCQYRFTENFIEASKKHVQRLVKRDRNHPSVIMWSVENECLPAYHVRGDNTVKDEDEVNIRIYSLAEAAKALDSTRPTSADGSHDLGGRMEIMSIHYPTKEKQIETGKPISIGEMGSMYYSTPDCVCNLTGQSTYLSFDGRLEALGREAFENLKCQRKWAAQVCVFNIVWYGLYPLPFKERICAYEDYTLPGIKPTKIGPYISTLNAGYDPELPGYIPNPIFKWVQKAYIPERFFFEDEKVRYYNGKEGCRRISVHNDSLVAKQYAIHWSVEREREAFFEESTLVHVQPSVYEFVDIVFKLPYVESIEHCTLHIEMSHGQGIVFEDESELKVYNSRYLGRKLKDDCKIGVIGCYNHMLNDLLSNENIVFITESSIGDKFDVYVIAGPVDVSTYELLKQTGKNLLDLSLDGRYFKDWSSHDRVEKAFLNVDDCILASDIDENDLYDWCEGIVSEYSFKDNMNGNCTPIITNGKGIPLVLELAAENAGITVSCLDLIGKIESEPVALALFVNLILYLDKRDNMGTGGCVLVSLDSSRLTQFFKEINVSFRIINPSDKEGIKSLKGEKILISDGEYPLDYLNEIVPSNIDQILICNLDRQNIPSVLKGYLDIEEKPLNQLVKAADHIAIRGIHTGNLYGLEAGGEVLLVEKPIKILDSSQISGILKNSDINWRKWNFQPENIKTISILRSEKEEKEKLYGLVDCQINNVNVLINQVNFNLTSNKLKTFACRLLTNISVRTESIIVDEFEAVLNIGIYEDRLKKALVLKTADVLSGQLGPEINKMENGQYWNIKNLENENFATGKYLYGFYVYSPSDRTDLLMNPNLAGVSITSGGVKVAYLNDEVIGQGNEITLNALKLKPCWNKIIISEDRQNDNNEPIEIRFTRKDNQPIDLAFSLKSPGIFEIQTDDWILTSNYNPGYCKSAISGRGLYWDTIETQREGMYLLVDMGGEFTVSGLQFVSISRGEHGMLQFGTPRNFVILISLDGDVWNEIYWVKDESSLSMVDGRVILNFNKSKARYIKILIVDVALKTLRISELRVFTSEQIN